MLLVSHKVVFIKNEAVLPCLAMRERAFFHFIPLNLFSVGLTNSHSKITNKYKLKQKILN